MPHLTVPQKMLWLVALFAMAAAVWLLPRAAPEGQTGFRPSFALPDTSGKLRDAAEFRGKYLLVFFGFTNCPDVCPTTLVEVGQVMDGLGDKAGLVQPVFISVDPERDLQLGLGDYVQAFHPSILGLAGDQRATKAAADSFKVYYSREADAAAAAGYTMSHSPALYLIGPDGEWLRQFGYGTPAPEILKDLESRP